MLKQKGRAWVKAVLSATAALGVWVSGAAQAAPLTLTIVVPFAAGGPTDKIAHAFANAARRYLPDQDVVVENVGGGGGTTGAAKVAKARPDGSTILLHNIAISAASAIYPDLPYDPLEFEYLGMVLEVPMTLIGRTSLPATFGDLRYWVAGKGNAITIAHAGVGSASHLCGMLIQSALKTPMTEKAYQGNAPAMVDLVAGKVDLLCDVTSNAAPQIEAGKVRAFGVTAAKRLQAPALRYVPAMNELGVKDAQLTVWFGLSAPKGTPRQVVQRLNAVVRAVASDPDFVRSQEETGAMVVADERLAPASHKVFVANEINHWSAVIGGLGGLGGMAERAARGGL